MRPSPPSEAVGYFKEKAKAEDYTCVGRTHKREEVVGDDKGRELEVVGDEDGNDREARCVGRTHKREDAVEDDGNGRELEVAGDEDGSDRKATCVGEIRRRLAFAGDVDYNSKGRDVSELVGRTRTRHEFPGETSCVGRVG